MEDVNYMAGFQLGQGLKLVEMLYEPVIQDGVKRLEHPLICANQLTIMKDSESILFINQLK